VQFELLTTTGADDKEIPGETSVMFTNVLKFETEEVLSETLTM
jgi:hypothetical protein